ncbi:MAG: DUF3060 domain-containing protein [Acidobacteriota bacterium]|nr:MAG: DUF3060 domain-containing protein [Acidobacteriota bacterium]
MRFAFTIVLLSVLAFASCDLRNETAKRSMERFTSSPTPKFSPAPTESPVDAADVAKADTSVEGEPIYVDGPDLKRTVNCAKFNSVKINGNSNNVTITGVCKQVMINGDRNRITADAANEYVFNGSENVLRYSRFVNGKRPSITQNREGNSIERIPTEKKK